MEFGGRYGFIPIVSYLVRFSGGHRRPVRCRRGDRVANERNPVQTGEIAVRQSHVRGARQRTVRHLFQQRVFDVLAQAGLHGSTGRRGRCSARYRRAGDRHDSGT